MKNKYSEKVPCCTCITLPICIKKDIMELTLCAIFKKAVVKGINDTPDGFSITLDVEVGELPDDVLKNKSVLEILCENCD